MKAVTPSLNRAYRYVWCAEDEKYGLLAVFATKKAAERCYGPKAKQWNWLGGLGGQIVKRKVQR